jgi:ADP-ribose pyrophosphatase YjhB (NUDIX family)
MHYKIFINGKPLYLSDTEGVLLIEPEAAQVLTAKYLGKKKFLHQYIDALEKNAPYSAILLHSPDLTKLWNDFQSVYKIIEAAGGVVENTEGGTLVIFRHNVWDLPKGKIDEGETPEQAAVREVAEETGLTDVKLGKLLCHTYHTYEMKGKRILKKTWWYAMTTNQKTLVPQTSEDITNAEWVVLTDFLNTKPTIYGSILDVLISVTI